ncbi:unnamed protein product [Peniophora sp. CBMAI 1063]|nr:unnamed protein product [Peniophora sp. CBMAI 1063]
MGGTPPDIPVLAMRRAGSFTATFDAQDNSQKDLEVPSSQASSDAINPTSSPPPPDPPVHELKGVSPGKNWAY